MPPSPLASPPLSYLLSVSLVLPFAPVVAARVRGPRKKWIVQRARAQLYDRIFTAARENTTIRFYVRSPLPPSDVRAPIKISNASVRRYNRQLLLSRLFFFFFTLKRGGHFYWLQSLGRRIKTALLFFISSVYIFLTLNLHCIGIS